MAEALLIFSVGPVQSFIAEARRVGDLDAGSEVLKRLSRAAGQAIQRNGGSLVYPARLEDDVPNKLVARAAQDRVEAMTKAAKEAIGHRWRECAEAARCFLTENGPQPDEWWKAIWERQTKTFWQTYWVAAPLDGGYDVAYDRANRAFGATKRTRVFAQVQERGVKDSLGGKRSALRTARLPARAYSSRVAASPSVTQAQLRPEGHERLDALGAIKRWGGLAERSPSVSHVATADFLATAKKDPSALSAYRCTIEGLLADRLYPVSNDPAWPYDGDLFFIETLTEHRLKDSYGLTQAQPGLLEAARKTLANTLYPAVGHRPSSYYAVVVFDGDSIGDMVSQCKGEEAHRAFSHKLLDSAKQAKEIIAEHAGHGVYVGGDDVLALAPLSKALPLAHTLARQFSAIVGATASAGIAIAHHRYPLDATLLAARAAERRAKAVDGKAAVCVRLIRRSGEQVDVRSRWDTLGGFERLVGFFRDGALSSSFAYAVSESAYAFTGPGDAFEAELKRLLGRHHDRRKWTESEGEWAAKLRAWAVELPPAEQPGIVSLEDAGRPGELARWLTFARFLARGGVA